MAGRGEDRSPYTWVIWGGLVAIAAALALGAVSVAWFGRDPTPLGLLVAVPFLAAALSSLTWTVLAGAVAVGVAAAVGDYDHRLGGRDMTAVLVGITAATVCAAVAASVKRRRIRQLRDSRTVADAVQQTLLRAPPDVVGDVYVVAHYESAARAAQVGGDVYEVLETPFGVRALVGDARGKGLPAVRLASATVGAFREAAFQQEPLVAVASQLDASLSRQAGAEDFVTAVLVQIDAAGADTVVCGHPPPLLISGGEVQVLRPDEHSLPLGLGVRPTCQRVQFGPGDRILLYTDGVSEARRRNRFFDLTGEVTRLDAEAPEEFLRQLQRRLSRWTRRRSHDDVAMLLLQRASGDNGGSGLAALDASMH
jgi:sigma-B regulation protein RsbU (phosphoserine phosphatase)